MPTKRRRVSAARGVPDQILLALGLGAGLNAIPDETLRALWCEWKVPVTRVWKERHGSEPFAAVLARLEGWDDE